MTVVEPETPVEGAASADDGVRTIPIEDGRFKVWTKRAGSGETKVLLLHGGPGGSHDYLKNFADSVSLTPNTCAGSIRGRRVWSTPSST